MSRSAIPAGPITLNRAPPVWLTGTVGRREAAPEPTGTYSRRVPVGRTGRADHAESKPDGPENRHPMDIAPDPFGYRRYWVPEHHGIPGVAGSATSVIIERIASLTERIRVGSGGVLLPNHSPLVLAEQFHGEIVGADSRQVYRYMNICTA